MHISIILVFWSLVRNSVMLSVYLLFLIVRFFTAHEHNLLIQNYNCQIFRKIGKFIRCSFSGCPCLYIFCLLHNLLFCGFLSIIFPYITGISICVNIRVIVYTCTAIISGYPTGWRIKMPDMPNFG